jgi:hypothetical protein
LVRAPSSHFQALPAAVRHWQEPRPRAIFSPFPSRQRKDDGMAALNELLDRAAALAIDLTRRPDPGPNGRETVAGAEATALDALRTMTCGRADAMVLDLGQEAGRCVAIVASLGRGLEPAAGGAQATDRAGYGIA